jgi:hypothetical protein
MLADDREEETSHETNPFSRRIRYSRLDRRARRGGSRGARYGRGSRPGQR